MPDCHPHANGRREQAVWGCSASTSSAMGCRRAAVPLGRIHCKVSASSWAYSSAVADGEELPVKLEEEESEEEAAES